MFLAARSFPAAWLFQTSAVCRKSFVKGYQVLSVFRKMMKDNDGATAIEYTLIAALISVAAITAMSSVGGKVSNVLGNVANAMT